VLILLDGGGIHDPDSKRENPGLPGFEQLAYPAAGTATTERFPVKTLPQFLISSLLRHVASWWVEIMQQLTPGAPRRFALLATASILVVGGVPASTSAHAASPRALITVHVGYIPVAELPLYTAIERGYFRQAGLDVVATPMANGAVITTAIIGGSLDIGVSNAVSMLLAASRGLQPVAITRGGYDVRAHSERDILVPPDSAIHSAADLEGKRVAVLSLNGIDHIALQQWIQDHGGNPSKVTFTELGGADMIPTLVHHQIDAAVTPEPARTVGLSQGMRVLGHVYADSRNRTFLGAFIAMRPWAVSHQTVIRQFSLAYNRGSAWANSHDLAVRAQYLTKYLHLPPDLAAKIHLVTIGKVTASSFTYWVHLAIRWKVLTQSINVKSLIWPTAEK
jgi:NitT/TauT family transport system substrate-binding protein